VTTPKTPIDLRPFRSKAEDQNEQSLQSQYRTIAIPEVVAAVHASAKGGHRTRPESGRLA
jgi:hypothetical protein